MLRLSGRYQLTAAAVSAETLAQLRDVLRLVDGEETDAFLSSLYLRAETIVSEYCGRVFSPSTWRLDFAGSGDRAPMPFCPVTAVTSCRVDGVELSGGFALAAIPGGSELRLDVPAADVVSADVTAGYATPLAVPVNALAVIFDLADELYNRTGMQSEKSLAENRRFAFALEPLKYHQVG